MSREIKFRAWDGRQMVHDGDYWNGENRQNNVPSLAYSVSVTNKGIHWCKKLGKLQPGDIVRDDEGNKGYTNWEIDRVSSDVEIMEYTGEQDTNGINIFENDMVSATWQSSLPRRETTVVTPVMFEDGGFKLAGSALYLYDTLEVIGNIYENPELLE